MINHVSIDLPLWIDRYAEHYAADPSETERMRFVIEAARKNVDLETGGPFAAGVFEIGSGKLVSLGVNLVTTAGLSVLHAEIVAITLAQRALRSYDLGADGFQRHELVTSAEPCAMCFGAIPWSGVRRVVCGARTSDAEKIGFDEGPKPKSWREDLRARDIETVCDVGRDAAVSVFDDYVRRGGRIYSPSFADRRRSAP